ncbi:MAG: (NiFe) hydrogenase maturation protein HypF [Acidobacteriaceae bacterium]|nr:(NiFe) hydrogenase maturation protein HypF [Acidobacteriaceae bacterium]
MAPKVSAAIVRRRFSIRGIVQGVGFRPFIYNLARDLELAGYIFNSASGVTVELEGEAPAIDQFLITLKCSPPPLAQITEICFQDLAVTGKPGFSIRESRDESQAFALVSPDVATCDECWRDFTEPGNRRFGYPFTNCTNCGPRYTIIQDVPYDRPRTTMAKFRMCPLCQAEYEDPGNRRFHAQPNACPCCGPSVVLVQRGAAMPPPATFEDSASTSLAVFQQVRALLQAGEIVAVKGLGGFFIACDARNESSVQQLRQRKRRSDKPFALMARDIAAVESMCVLTDEDRLALQSGRRPIVILARRTDVGLAGSIAPGNPSVGIMLPYTPLHALLFSDGLGEPAEFPALVMTSGNLSEEPIVTANEEAWQRLAPVADWFLLHSRDIYMRADDSVVRIVQGRERVLRRSRGYAPLPIDLGMPLSPILACGAELKNTLCLTRDRYAILSQHIGDLENYETLRFFEETLGNLKKLFRVEPQAVAYDLHPMYISSRYAQLLSVKHKIGVQHHHAHIVSCMAENHIRGKVIGVAFDGTGYGTDGAIWGGEFLIADYACFERRAHLRYVALPGGDAAVRQPWRMALSYLRDILGTGPLPALRMLESVPPRQLALVDMMLSRSIQTVPTSSCGRLFDAVAALVGMGQQLSFEGQAAIALESIADAGVESDYPFAIQDGEPLQVDMRRTIEAVVRESLAGISAGQISARFHNTVAAAIVAVCRRLHGQEGLRRVCLSGGVFQNIYLLEHTVKGLYRAGFEVFLHAQVPPNDGGIALGQAVIANERLREGD